MQKQTTTATTPSHTITKKIGQTAFVGITARAVFGFHDYE